MRKCLFLIAALSFFAAPADATFNPLPNPMPTIQPLPSAIIAFQTAIATTGTAVQLASHANLQNGVSVCAATTNAATIEIGPSGVTNTTGGSGNGDVVPPGACRAYAVTNTNEIYINGTSGDYVSVSGN